MALTAQKINFAEAYIRLGGKGHGTEAAIEAGYSEKSAHAQACRLLKDAEVLAYIRGRLRAMRADVIAQTDEVMEFFSKVMRGEVKDQFDLDAQLADRIKAGVELMKRYTCIEERESRDSSRTTGAVIRFEEDEDGEGS